MFLKELPIEKWIKNAFGNSFTSLSVSLSLSLSLSPILSLFLSFYEKDSLSPPPKNQFGNSITAAILAILIKKQYTI